MSTAAPSTGGTGWRTARRVLLVLIVAAGAGVMLLVHPTVCRTVPDANTGAVSVCSPMPADDVRVLLFLLIVGLLLLPELSELEIAGLVTLRRRVAEARAEASEAKAAAAEVQAQLASLSVANANASSTTVIHNHLHERQQETDAAIATAQLDQAIPIDESRPEPVGPYAVAAFQAGLHGLTQLLPPWAVDARLIGMTIGEDGSFEPRYVSAGLDEATLTDVAGIANGELENSLIEVNPDRWLAVSVAAVESGQAVGALAIVIPDPGDPVDDEGNATGPEQFDELGTALEIAAGAYARLLVDLLGDAPQPDPGAEGSEE